MMPPSMTQMVRAIARPRRQLRKDLAGDRSGVSMVEFGLTLPLLMIAGMGGLEYVNLVLSHQKIERVASATADAIARNTLPPSERTFQDTFLAMDQIGRPFRVAANGRTILTGVIGINQNGTIVNKIVWQRCGGALLSATSTLGAQWTSTTNYADGPNITLPNNIVLLQNQMVVVSEVTYRYQPLIGLTYAVGIQPQGLISQRAMFVTRGQAFPNITPSAGVTPTTCAAPTT